MGEHRYPEFRARRLGHQPRPRLQRVAPITVGGPSPIWEPKRPRVRHFRRADLDNGNGGYVPAPLRIRKLHSHRFPSTASHRLVLRPWPRPLLRPQRRRRLDHIHRGFDGLYGPISLAGPGRERQSGGQLLPDLRRVQRRHQASPIGRQPLTSSGSTNWETYFPASLAHARIVQSSWTPAATQSSPIPTTRCSSWSLGTAMLGTSKRWQTPEAILWGNRFPWLWTAKACFTSPSPMCVEKAGPGCWAR